MRIKLSRLLMDSFMGMSPCKAWDGRASVHGGCLIAKPDKEIACFHLNNRNKFEDRLFNRTFLDAPSTTRHGFGEVFEEDGGSYFKINRSVRMR